MIARRLRAPSEDGGLLAEPTLHEAPTRLEANSEHLQRWEYDFQGRPAGRLRALARTEVTAKARSYLARFGLGPPAGDGPPRRLIVTGHQPELFHPGVWIKNFAIAAVGRESGAAALNLIVDDDVPKGASIRVPYSADGLLRTSSVEFDEWWGESPYEDWTIRDESRFRTFADRVRATLDPRVADPIIDEYWPLALDAARRDDHVGLRLAAARRALEQRWGIENLEVPLSSVCETDAFLWFACHLLAHLPRFQETHNGVLARYRALHGIRSRHHPIPALDAQGDWLEAPFWAWRTKTPRRRPLLVRQLARTMQLRIGGEDEPFAELALAPDREACCAVDQLRELPAHGIRLRTRALTTTMFARLIVGDLFAHGIGGAKYDEVGDEIVREFFGFPPPEFLILSMTLWLGLDQRPASADGLRKLDSLLRDLTFNPDRHLDGARGVELVPIVLAKGAAIAAPVATRRQRIDRHYEILRCNEALHAAVRPFRDQLEAERKRMVEGLRVNRVARNREFAFVLHSRSRVRRAIVNALPGLLVQ